MNLGYDNLGQLFIDLASIFRPPERLSVAEAAEKYVVLNNPPVYIGPYLNEKAPYMVQPMNMVASRDYSAVCFVGPAQSAKTQCLTLNVLAYTIKCDPRDTILYEKSQSAARDFSKRRLDRLHRHSKDIGAELSPGQHADNTYDKLYKSGMMFTMSWPSINEMSGRPVPLVLLTDYDRMPQDVDGEGAPFDLGQKRTTTFSSFAMTVVESSPGYSVSDPQWKANPDMPNEAPPCEGGILPIYNRGTRCRWVWPCLHCGEYYEPTFALLQWTLKESIDATGDTVRIMCPHCNALEVHSKKHEMNNRGIWLIEGETIDRHGNVGGTAIRSDIYSCWLKGPAATFITWKKLVTKYLQADQDYRATGAQEALKTTVNADQGEAYTPKGSEELRLAEDLMEKARPFVPRKVPKDVRALIAMIDVQKNRWEVQIHGILPGNPFKLVVIDRFPIIKSDRVDDDGERLWVKPHAHLEDWDKITEEVLNKKYDLEDDSGTMKIAFTLCDSGGKEGVTVMAYNFWRKLKRNQRTDRFFLLKGNSHPNAPRVSLEYQDSQRKDRFANARGEIPLLEIQTNLLKDFLNGMIDDDSVIFPDWLDKSFYDELIVETRDIKGNWENKLKRRNESWDLLVYAIALCIFRNVEKTDWAKPPMWLSDWDKNPNVEFTSEKNDVASPEKSGYVSLAALGQQLG